MITKKPVVRITIAAFAVLALLMAPMYFILTTGQINMRTDKAVLIDIKPSITANDLAKKLKHHKMIRSATTFKLWLSFKGLDKKIIAGEYKIKPSDTIETFINRVTKGRMYLRKFTILPGQRWHDVQNTLKQSLLQPLTSKQKRLLKGRSPTLEGVFKPDTYFYTKNDSAYKVLMKAKRAQKKDLYEVWDQKDASLSINSPNDLLIIASLIEKETHFRDEYPKVSRVIHNRYNIGMGLNIDATVTYALLEKGIINHPSELTRVQLRLPSRYNTYLHRGLPIGPIAYPSLATLYAAAHPEKGHWLYYRVGADGKHVFSTNLTSHRAVNITRNMHEG